MEIGQRTVTTELRNWNETEKNTDPVLSGQKQYGCQKPAHGD